MSEPKAPPVMMMGPSAPNGPPEPMAMAAEMRLEHGHFGVDARAVEQDGFDGFGDAVAADFLRSEMRHDADQYAADDGSQSHPVAEGTVRWTNRGEAEVVEVEDVCGESDGTEKQDGEGGGSGSDDERNAERSQTRRSRVKSRKAEGRDFIGPPYS